MKKLILSTLIASCLLSSVRAQEAQNILVVDVVAVVNGFYDAQTTQTQFNSAVEDVNAEIQKMASKGIQIRNDALQIQTNAQDPKVSVEGQALYKRDFDAKAADLNQLEKDIQDYRQKNLDDLNKRQTNIVTMEMGKVKNAVEQIAKKHNGSLVLNSSGLGSVVFSKPDADITSEVIALLNEGVAKPSPSTLQTGAGAAPATSPMSGTAPDLKLPAVGR